MNNWAKMLAIFSLLLVVGLNSGCNIIGWMAAPYGSDIEEIDKTAEYTGLEGKHIAVLVAATDDILFRHQDAMLRTSRAMSGRLADNIESLKVMAPSDVIDFQMNNPYWNMSGYANLIDSLGVDAIVVVDLSEYRTHEPGNMYQWKGIVAANVTVAAKNGDVPGQALFSQIIRAEYPEDSKVGVIDSDSNAIQLGMLSIFSRDAAGLFYDHTVVRKTK
ncbi:hypothetical protein JD969_05095 [Planctomycetota bacterium]|nr:hypothetical protein JD969_05095 [Planctomycetota bacterium]